MRYYTQQVFPIFWDSIGPSATHVVCWVKAQGMREKAFPALCPALKGQLMDTFFVKFCQVTTFLREPVIADCGVSTAVSRIMTSLTSQWHCSLKLSAIKIRTPLYFKLFYSTCSECNQSFSASTRVWFLSKGFTKWSCVLNLLNTLLTLLKTCWHVLVQNWSSHQSSITNSYDKKKCKQVITHMGEWNLYYKELQGKLTKQVWL